MSPQQRHRLLDHIGAAGSLLCAIHCALLPVAIAFLPSLGIATWPGDGFEVGFHGEYREIVPDEKVVSTETYEGLPEGVSEEDGTTVNTATFTESGGRTILTLLIQAPSKATRDAIIDSGMEAGLQDALDLLEEVAGDLR